MDDHPTARSAEERRPPAAPVRPRGDRRRPAVIGIDVGTSALKALLADADGSIRAVRRRYRLDVRRDGRVELDADRVWRAARSAIRELGGAGSEGGLRIVAICVGGSGDEAVWLDGRGRPVAPVPMALDRCAEPDGGQLVDAVGRERFMAITGLPPSGAYPLPRLLWLRRTAPDRAERVRRLLAWPEFLAARLGVEAVAEPTLAARSAAFDVGNGAWSTALLDAAGVAVELFPAIAPTGSTIGTIPAKLADAIDLPAGVHVVAGGFDQAMATLGAGIVGPGIAHLGAGSWEALSSVRSGRSPELVARGFGIGPAIAAADRWSAMTSWPGTVVVGWVGRLGGLERSSRSAGVVDVRRALAVARAANDEPTDVLVLPDLDGSAAGGATIAGLRIDVDAAKLGRAILEGISFAAAEQIESLHASGDRVEEIRITGGGAIDPWWLQLRADVLGIPIVPLDPLDTGVAAAAALAWSGAVGDRSIGDVLATLVRSGRQREPRSGVAAAYEPMRARWRALQASIAASSAAPSQRR